MNTVTRVLAVANQKGGVAKTTTVASLGAAMEEKGRRVLLVDLDPQGCLTFSLGQDPDKLAVSMAALGINDKPGFMELFSSHPPIEVRIAALQGRAA